MPRLSAKDRKQVATAEATTGEFQPLTPGKYLADLAEVEARTSNNGDPMWNVTFNNIRNLDGDKQPGRQWYTLMLPIDAMPDGYRPRNGGDPAEKWEQYQNLVKGRLKAFFEAFGYSVDSDTDEMLGETALLQIGIETIQKGARTGQKTNRVNAVLPIPDDLVDKMADEPIGDDDF